MYEILIAVDDENAHVAAQMDAIEDMIAVSDEAIVHLLHVFTDNPSGASVQQVETVRNAKRRLESLDIEVRLEETSGDPAAEILGYAERYDIDQICVGGRKRSPAGKALFGSVTQSVILGSDRPVLVCGAKTDV
jgi:nucleotide-binding universal stress UspA family protein